MEPEVVRFTVKVKPRSSKSGVTPGRGELVIAVHAPALKGAANREMVEVLSQALDIPRSRVRIVRGEKSRRKLVEVSGLTAKEALARIERGGRA